MSFGIIVDFWIIGDFWISGGGGGQTDRRTDRHTNIHINTMTRLDLGAGPSENNKKQSTTEKTTRKTTLKKITKIEDFVLLLYRQIPWIYLLFYSSWFFWDFFKSLLYPHNLIGCGLPENTSIKIICKIYEEM